MIILWAGGFLGIIFSLLKVAGFLRIKGDAEDVGLDAHEFFPAEAYSPKNGKSAGGKENEKPITFELEA